MGYTVSVTVKPLTSSKVSMSIGHDFRTSYTRNVRNNNSNRIINLSNGYVENFKSNDNLINQNLKYNFSEDGSIKLKDKKNIIEEIDNNNDNNIFDFLDKLDNEKKEFNLFFDEEIQEEIQEPKNIIDENLEDKILNKKNVLGQILFKQMKKKFEKMETDIKKIYKEDTNKTIPNNSKFFQEGVITFGANQEQRDKREFFEQDIKGLTDEEVKFIRKKDKQEMDKAASNFIKKFEEEHGVKVLYLIAHEDEKTPHYHFCFSNFDFEKKRMLGLNKRELINFNKKLQTDIADSFSSLGFERGKETLGVVKQKTKAEKLNDEINDNNIIINYIKKSVTGLKNKYEAINTELTEKDGILNDLNSLLRNKNNTLENLKEEILNKNFKLDNLNLEIMNKLKNDNLDLYNKIQKVDSLENEILGLNSKIDNLDNEKLKLQEENLKAKRLVMRYEEEFKKAKSKISLDKDDIVKFTKQLKELNNEVNTLKHDKQALKDDLELFKEYSNKSLEQIKEELETKSNNHNRNR